MGESMTGLKRSHMCTEVNETMIGKTVTIMGWVQRRRDFGQFVFVILRDRTGIVQIVVNINEKELFQKVETVRSEFVLAVKGSRKNRTKHQSKHENRKN